jgi:hypothetical protein
MSQFKSITLSCFEIQIEKGNKLSKCRAGRLPAHVTTRSADASEIQNDDSSIHSYLKITSW